MNSDANLSEFINFSTKLSEEMKKDSLLSSFLAEEEMNAWKKSRFDGKFEELSDLFRQRSITKEMRAYIDKFSKEESNYKKIDISDRIKQKIVAVLIREQFQVLM